jgi:hypothetical protein
VPLVALTLAAAASAAPLRDVVPGESAADRYAWCLVYQQRGFDPTDAAAEACTFLLLDHRRMHRMWMAGTGHLDEWLDEYRSDREAALERFPEFADGFPTYADRSPEPRLVWVSWWMEGRTPPIDVDGARRMLDEVLREEALAGRPPTTSPPARWSGGFRRRHPWPHFDRLLVTLAGGTSSQFLRTGTEEELVAWIAAQPPDSVTLASLFRATYRLHDGDVYLALLCAENVLSRYFLEPDRDALALHDHLRPLIDTFEDRGDQFGAWYHLFGTMLYSFSHGAGRGAFAGWMETFGSRFSNEPGEVELQEAHVNRIGVALGAHLRRRVARWGAETLPVDPGALAEEAYMDRDEFGARCGEVSAPTRVAQAAGTPCRPPSARPRGG